jgi:hypothetical protein
LDLAYKNRKDDAKKVLEKADKMMLQENFPYGLASRGNEHNRLSMIFMEACYRAGDNTLGSKVLNSVRKDLQQQMKFYNSLTGAKADNMSYDKSNTAKMLQDLDEYEKEFSNKQPASSLESGGEIKVDTGKK